MAVPTYHGSASNPADNGSANEPTTLAITPPASMQAGDLVVVVTTNIDSSASLNNNGGQTWNTIGVSSTPIEVEIYWCQFDGTWDADPSWDFAAASGTKPVTAVMHVYRPANATGIAWSNSVVRSWNTYSAPTTPFTVSRSGLTATKKDNVIFAIFASTDDNTWNSITGSGWVVAGSAQYRNTAGADMSSAYAHKLQAGTGASGTVTMNQVTLGGDEGVTCILIFSAEAPPTVALNTPADAGSTSDTTPTFDFTGSDLNGDDLEYEINIDTVNTFDSVPGNGGNYYFDGSDAAALDVDNVWTNETNSDDGDTGTTASTTTGGSPTSGEIFIEGTNAPASGGEITLVRARVHDGTDWGAYVSLSVPSGGWTWAKVQGLEATIYHSAGLGRVIADIRLDGGGTGLGSPFNATSGGSSTVSKVEIEVTAADAPLLARFSETDSGFVNPDVGGDTHPFTQGDNIQFTVQAGDELTAPDTYYWRVRAKDPDGINAFGAWSSTRSFDLTGGATPVTIQKSLKYTVLKALTITKSLKYTVKTTPSTITKSLKYTVRKALTITKSLKYTTKISVAAITKSLKYTVKTTPATITKSLKYTVRKALTITKTLVYIVKFAVTIQKSLKYYVLTTPATITKSLKYTIKTTPSAITKSLTYGIKPTITLQKSLKYTVVSTPSAITKSLKYTVTVSATAITKSLKYTVTISQAAITKSLAYFVRKALTIQKSLRYIVVSPVTIQKSLKYTVITTVAAITKSLRYIVVSPVTIQKSLKYTVVTSVAAITKSLKYTIKISQAAITKSLKYTVVITPTAITKSLQYNIVGIDVITIQKSLKYSVKTSPAITKSLKYTVVVTRDSATESTRSTQTVQDDASIGVQAWENPENATASDNIYATTIPFTGETETRISHYLKATNFGFNIPAGSVINGIKLEVERKKNTSSSLVDHSVKIVKSDGSLGTENKAGFGAPLWSGTDTYRTYGGETDLWSESWTVDDINDSDFGAAFSVMISSDDNSVFASVDHMRITVYFLPPNAKVLKYAVVVQRLVTKSLAYSVIKIQTITKNLKYTVLSAQLITKSLRYYIFIPQTITKSLQYIIRDTTTIQKSLKYTVKYTPSAISKSLKYTVVLPLTITKSLRYAVVVIPATITKSLKYTVSGATVTIQKSLKYTVKVTPAAITKTLVYIVKTTPATITKSLRYFVEVTTTINKSLRYEVRKAITIQKSLKYTVKRPATITKQLRYFIETEIAITKSLRYAVRRPTTITKSLTYHVIITTSITITKSLKYVIIATAPTITKSLRYVIRIYPYANKSSPYSNKTSPYARKNSPYTPLPH